MYYIMELSTDYGIKVSVLCGGRYRLMLQCWQETPDMRPDFRDLQGRLQAMVDDTQVCRDDCIYNQMLHSVVCFSTVSYSWVFVGT